MINRVKTETFLKQGDTSVEPETSVMLEDLLSSFCEMKQSGLYHLPNWALDQG